MKIPAVVRDPLEFTGTPERRLLAAVLHRAILDLARADKAHDAERYLRSRGVDTAYVTETAGRLCEALAIPHDRLVRMLEHGGLGGLDAHKGGSADWVGFASAVRPPKYCGCGCGAPSVRRYATPRCERVAANARERAERQRVGKVKGVRFAERQPDFPRAAVR